jgi:hypothetical protein
MARVRFEDRHGTYLMENDIPMERGAVGLKSKSEYKR